MSVGLDLAQTRLEIIRPALKTISHWSPAAENLVLGTGLVESRLRYVKQIKGPALGIFQIEPATYRDLWLYFIAAKPSLALALRALIPPNKEFDPPANLMVGNLSYAAAMCRVFYLRVPTPLPEDALGMARYWKRYYNTELGKGTVEKALPWFELATKT